MTGDHAANDLTPRDAGDSVGAGQGEKDSDSRPLVPEWFRTGAYVVGTFSGAVAFALVDAAPLAARILTAVATACLTLAVGYHPTR